MSIVACVAVNGYGVIGKRVVDVLRLQDVLGLSLLVGIVVLIMRTMGGFNGAADRRRDTAPRPAPMDILRERFARGEITEAEFKQAKSALGDVQ